MDLSDPKINILSDLKLRSTFITNLICHVSYSHFVMFPTHIFLCFLLTICCVLYSVSYSLLSCFLLTFSCVSYSQFQLFPTRFLLVSYSFPTRFLLVSYSFPTRFLLVSYSLFKVKTHFFNSFLTFEPDLSL